jgi:hypothetical protein
MAAGVEIIVPCILNLYRQERTGGSMYVISIATKGVTD